MLRMEYQTTENLSLLDCLSKLAPGSSKNSQRNWVKVGRVTIDGKPVKRADVNVKPGQRVFLQPKSKALPQHLRILYEDRHFVVVDKPRGLLSVSTAYETDKTVHGFLKEHYFPTRVMVVHRLDQDTSGVMLFALSEEAFDGLKDIFRKHDLQRSYAAIVEGHLDEGSGSWQSYLWEDANYRVHSSQDPTRGQKAITHYEVKGVSRKSTWLELTLETGKKNQIRIHCQEAGHPIVGDIKYGATGSPVKRLCLHAHLLAFKHPITGKMMSFTSAPPPEFYKLVNVPRSIPRKGTPYAQE